MNICSGNWTAKPQGPGLFLVKNGDVVTENTVCAETFKVCQYGPKTGMLIDSNDIPAEVYHPGFRFLKINTDALNEIGNE